MRGIGVMSGTSVDSIDLALVEITETPKLSTNQTPDKFSSLREFSNFFEIQAKTVATDEVHWPDHLKSQILELVLDKKELSLEALCKLDYLIAQHFAAAITEFIKLAKIQDIDFIASHGQTVYHEPPTDQRLGKTMQLGRGDVIHKITGITTITDFRTNDMSHGGQGAPLVPAIDFLLFRPSSGQLILFNVGGIANLTSLPANNGQCYGFDSGPGNCLIDNAANVLFGRDYDAGGQLAAQGLPKVDFLREFVAERSQIQGYLTRQPPKSTGRELFSMDLTKEFIKAAKQANFSDHDTMATLTYFTAETMANAVELSTNGDYPVQIYISGGGLHNLTLLSMLEERCQNINRELEFMDINSLGVSADYKEATAFAVLGYLRLRGVPANLPETTGAERPCLLGTVYE